jgi:hypothetical protein
MLQQRGMAGAEPAPLRVQPAGEAGAVVDLQPFEEVAGEQGGKPAQACQVKRRDILDRPGDFNRVDRAVRKIESDGIAARVDARPIVVDDGSDLAEAPA